MLLPLLISGIVGYVLGALAFGYWVSRCYGIDIFQHGSRNPGATNVRRVLGGKAGNLVFLLDAMKGATAAGWPLVAGRGLGCPVFATHALESAVAGLAGALVGHSFSCFTRMRGGKGVATSVGGFAVLFPVGLVVGAAVWALVFYTTRYVSLASMLAGLTLPTAALILHAPTVILSLTIGVAVFVVVRHRSNLVRLFKGTESRFARKSRGG
ncbi:MAG: glycerol-3-phosphate 1-O-acyltransferase PlsY [Opitutaceae bacterium]|nr:glycerol-3-phosphate 1-O-acyltransferase PlsY [Opitutaceae bacterium]